MLDPQIAKQILKLLDFDGSGTVRISDLQRAFMGTGLSQADVNEFIQTYARIEDGVVNLDELTAILNTVHRKTSKAEM
ncbi:unnamed protein product [Hymenolepis diminuta]|uniref:EF-hand domain-containing protein n=1 Tax=Hymenolepis diminuta TaxID=6216 RepID=A0A0R3SDX9_HYMDI|nr:unnamed protein product [Hymenolepis diminuta]